MSKPKINTSNKPATTTTYETTLEKRVLGSNLSDEDKINLIQLISNHDILLWAMEHKT